MAVGDIPASLQDTQQIGGNALYSKSVRVSDTIIAVAYTKDGGATSKLAIYTYAIDASGNIGNNLDSYVFANNATGALICGNFFRVRGDIFAVFSYDTDNSLDKALLRTFDIDSASGEITLLDDEIINQAGTREPTGCLVNATTGIIALARCNSTSRVGVYVETRAIDENGVIGASIDNVTVEDSGGALQFNEIIYDAEYGYLMGGYGNSGRTAGVIWSLSCDSSGNLGSAFTDTMAINTKFLEPSFTKITTGVYACICMGADSKMEIKSFTLASNGLLPASVTDTLVLSATASGWVVVKSSLVEVATGYYTYGFKSNDQVFVGTCTIGTNGAIGNSQLDTLAVTSTTTGIYAASMKVIQIKSGIYGLAYEAHDDDDTPYEAADYVNLATYLVDTGEVAKSLALTGTITTAVESDIVNGGETIVLTLSGDTWVASGATFNGQRQNIIDGLTSAQSEATGWNAEVRDKMAVTEVVRTSDTVVTITLAAQAGYSITANETITATIPATALTGAAKLVASPTFVITNESAGTVIKDMIGMGFIPFNR